MKAKKLYVLALALVAVFSLASCEKAFRAIAQAALKEVMDHDYKDSEEWGKVVSRDLELGDFSRLRAKGTVRFVLTQDSVCRVQAYGNEKRIEAYKISVEEGVLCAELKENSDKINKNTPAITLFVSAPKITEMRVDGAGDLDLKGDITQEEAMEIEVHGAGDVDIDNLRAENLKVEISGAGDVDIEHLKCQANVVLSVSGAGDIDAVVECQELDASVSGAGDMDLDVKCDVLRVSCSGTGDIDLQGECRKLYKNVGRASDLDTEGLVVAEP